MDDARWCEDQQPGHDRVSSVIANDKPACATSAPLLAAMVRALIERWEK